MPRLDDRSKSPPDVWNEFFEQNKPSAAVLRSFLVRLHDDGKHDHVIACIEAAIIHGQARPWMYDVLALSMELAGRPKEDVERVLLSRVDFQGGDIPSMLYSAAHLARFGGDRQALRMYRQASDLDPTRPEPYALGLKLAQKLKDYDAVGWACAGILTHVWSPNYEDLHRDAENAAEDARKALAAAGRDKEKAALDARMAEARQRDLILRLTWAGEGDLDLVVEEPGGTVCSFENPYSGGGGVLVHDGFGPDQKNCHEEYVCAFGAPGTYRVRIRHVAGNIVGKRAQLTIVQYRGTSDEISRNFSVTLEERDKSIRVPLEKGRRTDLTPLPKKPVARAAPPRRSLVQMMGGRLKREQLAADERFDESRDRMRRRVRQAGGGADVGYQPVISVLSEGVTASAMAVVSADRRYVRITTVPSFTAITDVFTFTFQGGAPSNGTQSNPTGTPGQLGGGFGGP